MVAAGPRLAPAPRPHTEPAVVAGGAADEPTPEFAQRVEHPDSRADVVKAYAPYAIIIAVFVICQITAVKKLLDKATVKFQWPGLDVVSPKGKPVTLTEFTLNLLTTPGTQMLIAGVLDDDRAQAVGCPGPSRRTARRCISCAGRSSR